MQSKSSPSEASRRFLARLTSVFEQSKTRKLHAAVDELYTHRLSVPGPAGKSPGQRRLGERDSSLFREARPELDQNLTDSDMQMFLLNRQLKNTSSAQADFKVQSSFEQSFQKSRAKSPQNSLFQTVNFTSFEIAKVQDSNFSSKISPVFETFQLRSNEQGNPEFLMARVPENLYLGSQAVARGARAGTQSSGREKTARKKSATSNASPEKGRFARNWEAPGGAKQSKGPFELDEGLRSKAHAQIKHSLLSSVSPVGETPNSR